MLYWYNSHDKSNQSCAQIRLDLNLLSLHVQVQGKTHTVTDMLQYKAD